MGRRIRYSEVAVAGAQADGQTSGTLPADNRLAKIAKMVPAEVLAFYIGISNFLAASNVSRSVRDGIQLFAFLLGAVASYLVLRKASKKDVQLEGPLDIRQNLLTVVAFIVWAMATSAPFALFGWSDTSLVAGVAMWVLPLVSALL